MPGIWLLADSRQLTLELIRVGRQLADEMKTSLTVFLYSERESAAAYFACGAEEVVFLPTVNEGQTMDDYVPDIAEEISRGDPDVFLVGGSARGREMAARIAARLQIGLCSDCIAMTYNLEKTRLEMQRLMYGGAAIQTVTSSLRPQMATIPAKTYAPAEPQGVQSGFIRELSPPNSSRIRIVERRPKAQVTGDVREAKVLVCVGRGIENESDLELARDLAAALGGEVACTRPLVEELHWLPEDTYIGLSGLQVKPDLYIGIGISGQIQHLTGIRESRVICAVNRDENAPIFKAADYGIVGDLYEVLPKLIKQVRKNLHNN